MTSIQFTAEEPDRVQALAVVGAAAKVTSSFDYPHGVSPDLLHEWTDMTGRWGTGVGVEIHSPSMANDERHRSWVARLERHTCSPSMSAAALRVAAQYDVRHLLPDITTPTLVLHRRGDQVVSIDQARYLASHIRGAQLEELPGDDHTFFLGDQQRILDVLVAFVDEHVAEGALGALLRAAERRSALGCGWESLTPSEREVASLAASGLTNAQIAERLRMSRHTVDGRLRRVFVKLDVASRVELTAEYARVER
jgi:DNA-binding CsgD family transcriptional regulator